MIKLGIVVVYFLSDEDIDILTLHLKSIHKHTDVDYTIYSVANRVSDKVKGLLGSSEHLILVDIPETDLRGSEEHAYYLDRLVEHAVSAGATHICTLDCDSFPIKSGWVGTLYSRLSEEKPVVAILRAENDDVFLPHPSMTFFASEFYTRYLPVFLPGNKEISQPDFQDFLLQTKQRYDDTGIGIAHTLYVNNLQWTPLLRSNQINDHYLLAGIYDGIIFHLGAMSWSGRAFRKDRNQSLRIQLAIFIRTKVMYCPHGSVRRKILDMIEASALNKIKNNNNGAYKKIRRLLLIAPDIYFNYLLGHKK